VGGTCGTHGRGVYSSGIQPGYAYPRGYAKTSYVLCITCIMYQQLWRYKVEEKLYLGVREQKRLNTSGVQGFDGKARRKETTWKTNA
jgi:hypothetical protein